MSNMGDEGDANTFANGKDVVSYYDNGNVKRREYFRNDGTKSYECSYHNNGCKDKEITYGVDGEKTTKIIYKDGLKICQVDYKKYGSTNWDMQKTLFEYDSKGRLIIEQVLVRDTPQRWFRKCKTLYTYTHPKAMNERRKVKEITYHCLSGDVKEEKVYHENGQLHKLVRYDKSRRIEIEEYYNEDGELRSRFSEFDDEREL